MSEMYIYIYVPKLPLFIFYCNARGFVLINILLMYLFSNFCRNKTNILYYIISYYILHPIIYNTCFLSYILKYLMFTFHSRHFRHLFVRQGLTWRQLKYCKPGSGRGLWKGLFNQIL